MFPIFFKNLKIQNGRHFWRVKNSLKLGTASLHRTPCGSKIWLNCSMSHCFQDTSNFKNSKWPPFLTGLNFFENWVSYSKDLPFGAKILSKSLYVALFSRYKHFLCFAILKKIRKFKWPPFLPSEIFVETCKA